MGYARDGDDACVAILRLRGGRLLGRDYRFLEHIEDEPDADVLSAYLGSTYLAAAERAEELLVPFDFEDRELVEQALGNPHFLMPPRGPRREIVDLAEQNSRPLPEECTPACMEADARSGSPL